LGGMSTRKTAHSSAPTNCPFSLLCSNITYLSAQNSIRRSQHLLRPLHKLFAGLLLVFTLSTHRLQRVVSLSEASWLNEHAA
jgi:hypothetical protein